ncbi:uncharacterized protein LOC117173567 [Belonocnema kinseyi]|uniref:uncharacterized protein LOC117173567 n=1 Tax=Belonocnema kinseyi TaxID=2817044 RepID=UPI00143DD22C|nr:uncharacterized protein LOC117173567 [Belonocnema kinseyi]
MKSRNSYVIRSSVPPASSVILLILRVVLIEFGELYGRWPLVVTPRRLEWLLITNSFEIRKLQGALVSSHIAPAVVLPTEEINPFVDRENSTKVWIQCGGRKYKKRYYRTTDSPPIVTSDKYAEKSENAAARFWAEIFGTAHIAFGFVIAFILQLLRFLLYSMVRPLTVGILQILADYFIKPFLSIVFNALIQPFLILLYNMATSLRDLCEPIAEALGFFFKEAANVLKACRVVEINQNPQEMDKKVINCS